MRTNDALRATRAVLWWVIPSIGFAEAGLFLVRGLVPSEALTASNDTVGSYLQTVGTIYAVLLAFVVFVVWSQFDQARKDVEREANELVDLHRTTQGLDAATAAPLRAALEAYVAAVLDEEWPAMARNDEDTIARVAARLEPLWDALVACEPVSGTHCALHEEALERFNDLSDARADRLTASRTRIPMTLRLLLYTGACITVGSLYLFGVADPVVHALMVGATAGALSHVLFVIHDLDDCFDGVWQVPRASFERVRRMVSGARAGR